MSTIEEFTSGLDPSPWKLRTLGALDTQCPDCGRDVVYAKAFELCPDAKPGEECDPKDLLARLDGESDGSPGVPRPYRATSPASS